MDSNKIGKFIASKRKENNLTQQELGDMLYVTDKAVSKWENGKGLPDITILKKLASILNVDVDDILAGENNSRKINIKKRIDMIQKDIDKNNRKKRKQLIILIIILIVMLSVVILRNSSYGFILKKVYYNHSDKYISIGIPKGSFLIKNNDRSYSIHNLRSANIIENETKKYLKELKYLNCNDTIYYYDEKSHFSIIDYSVKDKFLFTTLSYEVIDGDYCITKKLDDYKLKLGFVNGFHTLNGGKIDLNSTGDMLEVYFQDGYSEDDNDDYSFKAKMKVMYYKNIENIIKTKNVDMIVLEETTGRFEIVDDRLYYYRENIIENKIKLPEVSVFRLEDGKMYLTENYLSKYEKEIVLK